MKRSELVSKIEEVVTESGVTDGEAAEELASDIADRLEEEFGLIDEEEDADEEDEEET